MHPDTKYALLLQQSLGMQDFQGAVTLCHFAMQSQNVPGVIVEMGCHAGHTAAMLAVICAPKEVWLYDSFKGLPHPSEKDTNKQPFVSGGLKTTVECVQHTFERAEVRADRILIGDFSKLGHTDTPDAIASFIRSG